MHYCTQNDLALAMSERDLILLSNDNPKATEVNPVVVEIAIKSSGEIVDGYLRGRYNLPLQSTPSILKDITVNLARHWLHARRVGGAAMPEGVTSTYKTSLDMLTQIQNGKITLGLPSGHDAPEPGRMRARAKNPIFGRELLDKF